MLLYGGDNGNYEFVVTAFKMARERWPEAVLIYNDYNTVQWQKNEGIDLINKIKKAGAPVDAYGLQAHDMQVAGGQQGGQGGGGSCLNINTLKSAIEEIWNKTQMPMFISEYDIASYDDQDQKNCYEQQISYFMENEHIAGITLWGYIYGSTWTDGGNSGIIKDGKDRPAMTWLKEYLPSHPGNNTTGLLNSTPIEPEPQKPFKGTAFELNSKIEAENFDIPGKGAGNNSYMVGNSGQGDSDYRKETSVNLYAKNGGVVIGYNQTGNYYQYTINVPEKNKYIVTVNVAAEGTGAIVFKVGDKVVSDTITYSGDSWDVFKEVQGVIELESGEQILTLEIAKEYIDVDWFSIEKLVDCTIGEESCGLENISSKISNKELKYFTVFDMTGKVVGVYGGYSIQDITCQIDTSPGIYFVKSGTRLIKIKK